MILKNKVVFVYDVEIFPNVFHCIVKNTESKKYHYFEVSTRKNNIKDLIEFFSNTRDKIICGYNNIHYDNPIINFILDYKDTCINTNYERVCRNLFNLSNIIILSKDNDGFNKWKKWKYANNFETLDLLTLMFSQALRVGLKEMQITMRYNNVKEFTGKFNQMLDEKDIEEMIYYNKNDVDSTEYLLYLQKDAIDLRLGIEKEFGVNVLSMDGMSIGTEILKVKYLEKSGKTWNDIKNLRSPCDIIDLNEVIFPFIEYKTPVLQELLFEMKQQKVSPGRKGFEKHFLLGNLEVNVGVGGIHTKNEPEKIIPNNNERLLDSDVALA